MNQKENKNYILKKWPIFYLGITALLGFMTTELSAYYFIAVVALIFFIVLVRANVKPQDHVLWKAGYISRTIALLIIMPILLSLLFAGPYAIMLLFFHPIGWVAIVSSLVLTIGHYLADNWKDKERIQSTSFPR